MRITKICDYNYLFLNLKWCVYSFLSIFTYLLPKTTNVTKDKWTHILFIESNVTIIIRLYSLFHWFVSAPLPQLLSSFEWIIFAFDERICGVEFWSCKQLQLPGDFIGARSARAAARLFISSGINLIVPLSFHQGDDEIPDFFFWTAMSKIRNTGISSLYLA